MSDVTNRDRARWAHEGLQTYGRQTGVIGEDLETQMSDLVGDLMHLARFEGVPFNEVLRRAKNMFNVELTEDPDDKPLKRRRKEWDPRHG